MNSIHLKSVVTQSKKILCNIKIYLHSKVSSDKVYGVLISSAWKMPPYHFLKSRNLTILINLVFLITFRIAFLMFVICDYDLFFANLKTFVTAV